MAELSEADKKILLGADYKEKEQRREAAAARGGAGAEEKGDVFLSTCAFTGIVAVLILLGDYFRPAANRGHGIQIAAAVVFVLSLAVVVWRMQRGRRTVGAR